MSSDLIHSIVDVFVLEMKIAVNLMISEQGNETFLLEHTFD